MRILFIDNFPINFGASYVAAVLRQWGHDIHLLNYPLSKWKDPLMYQKPEDYFPFERISEEALDYYVDNKVKALHIFFLNYYPDSTLVKYSRDNGFLTSAQYDKIMKNEMLGEQSYRGTITDPEKSDLQMKYPFLFRLNCLLPGSWVKWLFEKNIHLFFPTSRFPYYAISILSDLAGRGVKKSMDYLLFVLRMSFPKSKKFKSKTSSLRPGLGFSNKSYGSVNRGFFPLI